MENQQPEEHAYSIMHQLADTGQPATFDNRAQWYCECEQGFTGADCAQVREMSCDNGTDDDQDGLTDCEDTDCCSQPACKDNHLCYQSPDPSKLLAELVQSGQQFQSSLNTIEEQSATTRDHDQDAFFAQYKFFIANNSVQLWAKESSFDPSQVAVIRGRVIRGKSSKRMNSKKQAESNEANYDLDADLHLTEDDGLMDEDNGIVSVHVRVADIPTNKIGFTLTRSGGHFDLLVPAQNSWITLHFLRNAYADVERQVFVRAQSINVLDSPVIMQLAASTNSQDSSDQDAATAKISPPNPDAIGIQQQQNPGDFSNSFGVHMLSQLFRVTQATVSTAKLDEQQIGRLVDCLRRSVIPQAPQWAAHEPTIRATSSSSQAAHLKTFRLASSEAYTTSMKSMQRPPLSLHYNSAAFAPANSIVKPTLSLELMKTNANHEQQNKQTSSTNSSPYKLAEILLHLDIDGQLVSERLRPIEGLSYQFAWNRRNVYGQKVYGFSPLNIKITYKYKRRQLQARNATAANNLHIERAISSCLAPYNLQFDQDENFVSRDVHKSVGRMLSRNLISLYNEQAWDTRTFSFEGRVYMEGHQLNQHTDLGQWTLGSLTNRLDRLRETLYLGSGHSIPLKLAYPLTVSEPISITSANNNEPSPIPINAAEPNISPPNNVKSNSKQSKTMTRGPNNTIYLIHKQRLIQLGSSGQRRLIDLSVSILTSKFGLNLQQATASADYEAENDLELLYNEAQSMLYVSSRSAGKIVQISHATLLLLNRPAQLNSSGLLGPDEDIEIEPLCGFGNRLSTIAPLNLDQSQSQSTSSQTTTILPMRSCRSSRLSGPHSMALDERRQMLYFVDGNSSLMALELATNLLTTLLSSRVISQQSASSTATTATTTSTATTSGENSGRSGATCRRTDLQLPLQAYKPLILSSLVFSQSDQSVYFVDQNTVFALRQDLSLELVALGSRPARADFIQALAPNCLAQKRRNGSQLGQIKALAIDEANHELVIAHQWTSQQQQQQLANNNNDQSFDQFQQQATSSGANNNNNIHGNNKNKLIGRFYLAKLKLGLVESPALPTGSKTAKQQTAETSVTANNFLRDTTSKLQRNSSVNPSRNNANFATHHTHAFPGPNSIPQLALFDLHSAQATYDETLAYLAGTSNSLQQQQINWSEVAKSPNISRPIPFLHLLFGGFDRIDSIEISARGSIFVLDSSFHTIRLVEQFNADFWALKNQQNSAPKNDIMGAHFLQWAPDRSKPITTSTTHLNSQVMTFSNPLTGDVMHFHSTSGLQIGLTTKQVAPISIASSARDSFGSELVRHFSLSYQLMSDTTFAWAEDDRNDLAIQRAFMSLAPAPIGNVISFARLHKIMDAQGIEYDIVRKPVKTNNSADAADSLQLAKPLSSTISNTKLIAQSISVNGHTPFIELACDMRGLLVRAIEITSNSDLVPPNQDRTNPLTPWTQRMNLKYDSFSNLLNEQMVERSPLANTMRIIPSRPLASNMVQLRKKIIYDKIFFHHCNLIRL